MQLRRFHAIAGGHAAAVRGPSATATPIKHLVVIFDENVSFDHYFGTYPFAANLAGESQFHAAPGSGADQRDPGGVR